MPKASRQPPAEPPKGQMLFLVGHGLQTPLSAIRWGCSRLQKMGKGTMTKEQLEVLTGIHHEAKILSGMLNALLLVARVEDGTHEPKQQDIYLHDFLMSFGPFKHLFPDKAVRVSCPKDLMLRTDRILLESLLEAVSVVIGSASESKKGLVITVAHTKGDCVLSFSPDIELSFLRDLEATMVSDVQIVGGTPGLMLSVIASLSNALGGTIDVLQHGKEHHLLSLHLPFRHTVPSTITA
jgi:K+-sensing histidine kinase KdpD